MICPKCQGTGCIACWDEENGRFTEIECDRCHGDGETVGTNDEWFASLSLKEKAKILANECNAAIAEYEAGTMRRCNFEYWENWLKLWHFSNFRPCPSCGGDVIFSGVFDDPESSRYPVCLRCGRALVGYHGKTFKEKINAWNAMCEQEAQNESD